MYRSEGLSTCLAISLVDLHEKHGRDGVKLNDFFLSAENAGLCLKDVVLNDRKSIAQNSSYGSYKTWNAQGTSVRGLLCWACVGVKTRKNQS